MLVVKALFVKLLYLLIGLRFGLCVEASDEELVFVNVVFRHGDRTPVDPYPNDPYNNRSYWPEGWGQLTNKGKAQHYELGKWLRSRYNTFLPSTYNRDDIVIQSTDVDRTLMSAYTNLAGLYQVDSSVNWNADIKWEPIPVHTVPEHADWILAAKKHCAKYDSRYEDLKNSAVIQDMNTKYSDLFRYLTDNSGTNVTDIQEVEFLYNTLTIEKNYNLTLPQWTEKVYPQPMKTLAEFSFTLPCYNEGLARFKSGPLLSDMIKNMQRKLKAKPSPDMKMKIYSGHDTTIANLLQSLKVFEPHSPPYCSTILLELTKKNGVYLVSVFYKNSSAEPRQLTIPGCSPACPFDVFLNLTKKIVPINWEMECRRHDLLSIDFADFATQLNLVVIVMLVSIIFVILSIFLQFYRRNRGYKKYIYHSLVTDTANANE